MIASARIIVESFRRRFISAADLWSEEAGVSWIKIEFIKSKNNSTAFYTAIKKPDIEFWYAHDLMPLLGYERWENFDKAISRAMESCEGSGAIVPDHFREVTKMVTLGSGAKRNVRDYMLTRYACYLIAQNGDPKKEEIAFAQSYFAVQTRKQELIEEHISLIERTEARGRLRESEKRLSQNIYERGVDDAGFGRIRSKGDQALFGGYTTQEMKVRLGVKDSRPLADFLPTLSIAAKNLAAEMTNYNTEEKDLQGEAPITREHVQNNRSVREMLGQRGIKPEELPPAEDIKKLERRVKSQTKKLATQSGTLPDPDKEEE
ncbi:MAG: DNA damage-inducible protein D [Evtepia sp.]